MVAVAVLAWVLLVAVAESSGNDCPGVTAPCSCGEGRYGQSLICKGITSELELEKAVQENTRQYHPEEFVLEDSELRFITHDTFSAQTFLRFLIRNTTILSLTNTHRAFEGLEQTLIELVVEKCDFVSHWDWGHLKHLTHLTEIQMSKSDLVYVSHFHKLPAQVTVLRLHHNEIAGLMDEAFATLPNLRTVLLNSNEIARIERNMFPQNAQYLETLDLSQNFLRTLPDDIFSNMPALKTVRMKRNLFKTISDTALRPVWKELFELDMTDNPLVCDCKLRWIIEGARLPKLFRASCIMPGIVMSRVDIAELKKVHFRCQ